MHMLYGLEHRIIHKLEIEYNNIKFQILFEIFFIEELDIYIYQFTKLNKWTVMAPYHSPKPLIPLAVIFCRLYQLGILCFLLKYNSSII